MAEEETTSHPAPRRNVGNLVRGLGVFIAFAGLGALALYTVQNQQRAGGASSPSSSFAAAPPEAQAKRAVTHTVSGPPGTPSLRRVMLSTGGVGYFEYEARVSGTAELQLPVRMDQVDDVLKSIVVFDDKGNTGFVQLPSRAPLSDIFRGLPFGPAALESNAALIDALKGAEVAVRASDSISGRVVSVVKEEVRLPDGDATTTHHRVGVMTSSGLKQFVLEEASSISFSDPVLTKQINQALASVAEHREGQGRTLKIRANGEGSRTVTIAYVVEAPLWKSSYRVTTLTGGKAHLQGWAILENVTGNDWVDVDLTVVTGNPVTFRQALYATYYVDRPEIPVEVLGRILPRPDEGSVNARGEGYADAAPAPAMAPPPPPRPESVAVTGSRARMDKKDSDGMIAGGNTGKPIAAESTEAATQVTFHMPFTVTVMNGQSLAVPIIDKEVPGDLVSLYQPETHARHPLAALKLTNASGTSLPPGVLTLYQTSAAGTDYVGDAQLSTLPDAEARMLAFALDQKILIDREDKAEQRISKATLANGIFKASVVDQRTTIYTIKGAAKEDRRVVVEHPRAAGWELVTPDSKNAEMTDTAFRIPFDVKAGATIKQTVTTQWPREEQQQLVDLDIDVVLAYAANEGLTPAQRAAFTRIGEYKRSLEALDTQIENETEARDRVFEDQGRIRENIKAVPAGSDLQSRYLRSMGQLEDQADSHNKNITRLQQQRAAEQQRLADYVAGLQL
ncbi:MAG: DUF4139 domain-containing protein [Alphaproteobacteria bacterium]|mgnify:CR=1 FL=1|nr:DUF4139 domain-containing protein [Alphaproteobacteria bacterium]